MYFSNLLFPVFGLEYFLVCLFDYSYDLDSMVWSIVKPSDNSQVCGVKLCVDYLWLGKGLVNIMINMYMYVYLCLVTYRTFVSCCWCG